MSMIKSAHYYYARKKMKAYHRVHVTVSFFMSISIKMHNSSYAIRLMRHKHKLKHSCDKNAIYLTLQCLPFHWLLPLETVTRAPMRPFRSNFNGIVRIPWIKDSMRWVCMLWGWATCRGKKWWRVKTDNETLSKIQIYTGNKRRIQILSRE